MKLLDLFWICLIFLFILFGLYFSFKLKFKNFKIISMLKNMSKNYKDVFFISIGTKVGVGSIVGTAIAIYTGGIGSIFWIWIFALLTSSWIYVESLLGSKYKQKLKDGYVGGPNFYIRYGLGYKKLSVIFLLILTISYSFFFLMIQTNTLNNIILINFKINKIVILVFAFIILSLVVFSSIKEIIKYINKTVPFMCVFLILISLFVLIKNYYMIIPIIKNILDSALNFKSVLSGLIPTIIISIKRNIFQNELLIGTTSISSAVNDGDSHEIAEVQVLANLFISFVICTLIAFLIIICDLKINPISSNYNELISKVFIYHFNGLGSLILITLVSLFSFTTIISGFYFGLTNLMFLTENNLFITLFRLCVLIFTFSGFILNSNIIWWLIDFLMLILIIINMFCIIKLRSKIKYDR